MLYDEEKQSKDIVISELERVTLLEAKVKGHLSKGGVQVHKIFPLSG
jgi:hypothetical protein